MSDKLARRRSLESLKKEAKRWFDALRRNLPDARTRFEQAVPDALPKPTLRDVQHALALEHGFSGWTELKHKLTADAEETTRALGQFEEMAEALLEAYRTGTPAAMERHWALTWHRRNHQAMRTYVQLDLGRQAGAANQDDDITLDDARFLVAREHGFERWDALVKFYTSVPVQPSLITTKPIRAPRRRDGRRRVASVGFARLECGRCPPEGRRRRRPRRRGPDDRRDARGRVAHRAHHDAQARRVSKRDRRRGASSLAIVTAATPRPERHEYHGSGTRGPAGAARAGDGLVGLDEGHGRRGRAPVRMRAPQQRRISRAPHPATVPSVHSRGRRACVN